MDMEKTHKWKAANQTMIGMTARLEQLEQDKFTLLKTSDKYSLWRGVSFVAWALVFILIVVLDLHSAFFLISAFLFFVFLFLVGLHSKNKKKIKWVQLNLLVHQQYLDRIQHNFTGLEDAGDEFIDPDHAFSADLDLFGQGSLFHLITVAKTFLGRKHLARLLLEADKRDKTIEDIVQRQQAVAELGENLQRLEEIQALGLQTKESKADPTFLLQYIEEQKKAPLASSFRQCVGAIIRIIILCISLGAGLVFRPASLISSLIILINLIVFAWHFQKFKVVYEAVHDFQKSLFSFVDLFSVVEKADFKSEKLTCIQGNLKHKNVNASDNLRKFHRIGLLIQLRSQPILLFLLNLFFSYDVLGVYFLEKWLREPGQQLKQQLEALGELEAYMSLCSLQFVFPEAQLPSIVVASEEEGVLLPHFQAQRMGHPLICSHEQVCNDFCLQKGVGLITGSNMSGKTTFLRTLGINAVLAYAGSVCCSENIELTLMEIGSSMRIMDNLSKGLSTFYAELIRIGKIIELSKQKRPFLFLIDEIFRGTNSRDRTDGALLVLKNLHHPWIIGLMSTHDYELCDLGSQLEQPLYNYHFSEFYDDEGIHFTYQLKEGISKSANAKYLMKMVGIY